MRLDLVSCRVFANMKGRFEEGSDEYLTWWASHESKCDSNYTGSSPAMEFNAAVTTLNDSKPYGAGVKIGKDECVGHVQKNVEIRLVIVKY